MGPLCICAGVVEVGLIAVLIWPVRKVIQYFRNKKQ